MCPHRFFFLWLPFASLHLIDSLSFSNLQELKPNWLPKADIPPEVPKLPIEYVHRHRLMRQVVSCLLDQSGAGPRDTDDEATVRKK